jgi:hypothetical protein
MHLLGHRGGLEATDGNQRCSSAQKRSGHSPLERSQCPAVPRRMPAGMEGQQIGKSAAPRAQHRQDRHRRMYPRAVDEIPPPAVRRDRRDPRCQVIVLAARPCPYADDVDPGNDVLGRQSSVWVRRQHSDLELVSLRHPLRDFVDVGLDATGIGQEPQGHHQDVNTRIGWCGLAASHDDCARSSARRSDSPLPHTPRAPITHHDASPNDDRTDPW